MNTHYYKADNTFSPVGFILVLLLTFLAGSLLCIPYLFLIDKIPYVYFDILLPVGAGFLIGYLSGHLAKLTKFKSISWGVLSILIGFAGFTIIKWALYVYNIYADSFDCDRITALKVILSYPKDFWYSICEINKYGTWSLSKYASSNIHGLLLWIIWFLELLIMFFSIWITYYSIIDIPFIENENNWAIPHKNKLNFAYFDVQAAKSQIENDPLTLFEYTPVLLNEEKIDYVSADIFSSSDGRINYLTLVTHVLNKKGEYSTYEPIKFLSVSMEFIEHLNHTADTLKNGPASDNN